MRLLFHTITVLLVMSSLAHAACVDDEDGTWTTTPDYASVSSCVAQAARGDTINITAGGGSATWSSTLTLSKGVVLVGPGESNLTISMGAPVFYNLIYIAPDATARAGDEYFRVTNFSISGAPLDGLIKIINQSSSTTPSTKIRLDNLTLTNTGNGVAIFIQGYVGGVGHDLTVDIGTASKAFQWNGDDWLEPAGCEWVVPMGSDKIFFIEDSTITAPTSMSMTSGGWGGKRGMRYNTVDMTGCTIGYPSIFDIHGDQTYPGMTDNYIYRNTIAYGCNCKGVDWGGGKGVVFDNTFYDDNGPHNGGGITVIFEPCSESCCTKTNDAYFWSNTHDGSKRSVHNFSPSDLFHNVDYWVENESFGSGASGIGVGTLASRPSTCTTGVAYWATDQGSWNQSGTGDQGLLYKCTSTDTWALHYTPLTYPHPLRRTSLSAPENLRIVGSDVLK